MATVSSVDQPVVLGRGTVPPKVLVSIGVGIVTIATHNEYILGKRRSQWKHVNIQCRVKRGQFKTLYQVECWCGMGHLRRENDLLFSLGMVLKK